MSRRRSVDERLKALAQEIGGPVSLVVMQDGSMYVNAVNEVLTKAGHHRVSPLSGRVFRTGDVTEDWFYEAVHHAHRENNEFRCFGDYDDVAHVLAGAEWAVRRIRDEAVVNAVQEVLF